MCSIHFHFYSVNCLQLISNNNQVNTLSALSTVNKLQKMQFVMTIEICIVTSSVCVTHVQKGVIYLVKLID